MLLAKSDLDTAYNDILHEAAGVCGACSVMMLVAPDCDAMCSAHILACMLRSDALHYKIRPVAGYADVVAADEEDLKGDGKLRSVVMFNCGALVNVDQVLGSLNRKARVYIIDSHRPVHLANLYSESRVVVVDTDGELIGKRAAQELPSDGEELDISLSTDEESEEEDDDEESGGEEEFDANGTGTEDKDEEGALDHEQHPSSDGENGDGEDNLGEGGDEDDKGEDAMGDHDDLAGDADDGGNDGADDDADEVLSLAGGGGRRGKKRKRSERQEKLSQYYESGNYHSTSSAVLMFNMALDVAKDTNDLLWLAIVGLTDQLVHRRTDTDRYLSKVVELKSHVSAYNPTGRIHVMSIGLEGKQVKVPVADEHRIEFRDEEFRFMHHRHWSLYNSMYYSTYVAARLKVWSNEGRNRLEELMAKMGFSLDQCRQKFPFMSAQLRSRLKDQINKYAHEYHLADVTYKGFTRCAGFKSPVAAADIVHSVSALMEHVEKHQPPVSPEQEDDPKAAAEADAEAWLSAFNDAYESLGIGIRGAKFFKEGLTLSMELQKAVVNQAVEMMQKSSIGRLNKFRYAYIQSGDCQEVLFQQPMALRRLAYFLIEVHHENGKWTGSKALPLVLLAERASTYLVVGVDCNEQAQDVMKNRFGVHFKLAAQECQTHVRHDGFDASAVEVAKEDVPQFIESLMIILNA